MRMIFVIAAAFLVFAPVHVVAQECAQVLIEVQDLEQSAEEYTTVPLILHPFDWSDTNPKKGVRYRILIGMDPRKARPDLNRWILEIYECPGWVEYVIDATREGPSLDPSHRWLATPLLLPVDEVGKVSVQAWVRGTFYRGVWTEDDGDPILLLTPYETTPIQPSG